MCLKGLLQQLKDCFNLFNNRFFYLLFLDIFSNYQDYLLSQLLRSYTYILYVLTYDREKIKYVC